eukprot:199068-Pyramimonas_sp.AAC.1
MTTEVAEKCERAEVVGVRRGSKTHVKESAPNAVVCYTCNKRFSGSRAGSQAGRGRVVNEGDPHRRTSPRTQVRFSNWTPKSLVHLIPSLRLPPSRSSTPLRLLPSSSTPPSTRSDCLAFVQIVFGVVTLAAFEECVAVAIFGTPLSASRRRLDGPIDARGMHRHRRHG